MRLNERAKRAKQARRTNARKSSGPKTEAGKLRVSRNALTHGLSIPIGLLPNSRAAIERLAHIILESINLSKNDPTAWYAACSFSEAHLDVERIRSLRSQALSRSIIMRAARNDQGAAKEMRLAYISLAKEDYFPRNARQNIL